jgi:hypothetical protein
VLIFSWGRNKNKLDLGCANAPGPPKAGKILAIFYFQKYEKSLTYPIKYDKMTITGGNENEN